jgi:isochorismate pyruvate lyase
LSALILVAILSYGTIDGARPLIYMSIYKRGTVKAPTDCLTIDEVRSEIDRVDCAIVGLLAQRRDYVQSIMRFKKDGADVHALNRQAQVIAERRQWAERAGLAPDLIETIYRTLIDHFVAEELALLAERAQS